MSKSFIALLALLATIIVACGGSDSAGPTPSTTDAAPSPSQTAEPSGTPTPQPSTEPPGRDLIDLARRKCREALVLLFLRRAECPAVHLEKQQ